MLYFCNTVQQILHFSIFHFPVFITFLDENLTHVLFFLNFCDGFAIILNENLTHVVFFHAACWPSYGRKQAHTFDVAKESLLSENTYAILTRAGPKTLPKKVQKNSFGGPS